MDISKARKLYYDFLGNFLIYGEIQSNITPLKIALQAIASNALDEESKASSENLVRLIGEDFVQKYRISFTKVFVFNDENQSFNHKQKHQLRDLNIVSPFYSHYTEGQIQGKDYLELKNYLLKFNFKINEEFKESEEFVGFLLLFMGFLIDEGETLEQKTFFNKFIINFIFDFIYALKATRDEIFSDYAQILKSFIEFDKEYLNS